MVRGAQRGLEPEMRADLMAALLEKYGEIRIVSLRQFLDEISIPDP
jgi:hypothetical protein